MNAGWIENRCMANRTFMSKLRRCFLYVLAAYVLRPLVLLAIQVATKERGLHRLRVGKLSVWGDSGFLDLCKSSIERLKTLDPVLYQALTRCRRVWAFQDPQPVGCDAPPWLYCIGSAYVAWQSDGILARLVYVAFSISEYPQGPTFDEDSWGTQQKVMKNSRSWLETRGFPQQLVDCYPDLQNKT